MIQAVVSGSSILLASGTAVWLGVLTSISPCPLASNVAALSYLARFSAARRTQLFAGLLYALGRAGAYVLVGSTITWGLLSAPTVSAFLQRHLGQLLGPFLVLVGMVLLGLLPRLPSFSAIDASTQSRLARGGLVGSALLGFVFALSFCPVSAALFFGSLLPISIEQRSAWLLPGLFGVGTAAPVIAFGIAIVAGRESAARLFERARSVDRWLLPLSGWLLVLVGSYLCVTRTLGLFG